MSKDVKPGTSVPGSVPSPPAPVTALHSTSFFTSGDLSTEAHDHLWGSTVTVKRYLMALKPDIRSLLRFPYDMENRFILGWPANVDVSYSLPKGVDSGGPIGEQKGLPAPANTEPIADAARDVDGDDTIPELLPLYDSSDEESEDPEPPRRRGQESKSASTAAAKRHETSK
ncbi:hypothetical protein EXIGLDRAFT_772668 [Exidia glandulosa HHB12029]|uniref:Uncharacterized protein n=1 Tax=Exidia glandulosa HHB12029 TaxID=1314781 RepID=A0A165F6K8_EXIGL|nr:hypothetical protein EXIGLDRAFT_772668 [Exidia glandulosa HHB12029]